MKAHQRVANFMFKTVAGAVASGLSFQEAVVALRSAASIMQMVHNNPKQSDDELAARSVAIVEQELRGVYAN